MSLINLPIGSIIIWENATIPSGWALCDGVGGTPDLRDKFVMGASIDGDLRTGGGANTHTHSTPSTNSRAAHNHGGSKGGSDGGAAVQLATSGTGAYAASNTHTHSVSLDISSANAHSHAVGTTGSSSTIPKYLKRVFIRRMS